MLKHSRIHYILSSIAMTALVASLTGATIPIKSHRLSHPTKPLSRSQLVQTLKRKNPSFFMFDALAPQLKAKAVRQNQVLIIKIPRGRTMTFPNGDRVLADGSWLIKRTGLKFQPILHNGKFTGRYKISKISRTP